jgi:hypothetical protein
MNRLSSTTASILAAVTALALIAGCGGGSGTATAPSNPKPTTGRSTSPPSSGPAAPSSRGGGQSSTSSPPSNAPATEFSPPGDIPDSTVFLPFSVPGARLRVSVPEGWSRTSKRGITTFTDKLNSVAVQVVHRRNPPTVASVRAMDVPKLASAVSHFAVGNVTRVTRRSGPAVLVTYQQDSPVDPVTGKVIRDAVERYAFWHAGEEAILTLSGPVGADNVDPWRTVTDSVTWK